MTVLHYVRAHKGDRKFKMVRGEIKGLHEARGEDMFENTFDALYQFTKALRAWRYRPEGIGFEYHQKKKGGSDVGSS